MNATKFSGPAPPVPQVEDESAVSVLRQLSEDRGPLLSDQEHAELRAAILRELAAGAEIRPFTLFTLAVVVTGVLGLMAVGLYLAIQGTWEGWLLAFASLGVLGIVIYLSWSFREGFRRERLRTIDARLAELEDLLRHKLISDEEFTEIRAGILSSRQHGGR